MKNVDNLRRQSEEQQQKMYACWLDTIYWLPSDTKFRLLDAAGSVRDVYYMTDRQLTALIGLKGCEQILQQRKRYEPQRVWDYVLGLGISYTYCLTSDFPQKLKNIPNPPFGIFYKGKLPDEKIPAVAMIGARKCSEYGKCMAENFATKLASHGINVISGMALGIDGISQRAALNAGGRSYGVLGCGVDVVYPRSNESLYRQLLEKGGVISEYPPGMEPRPILFPPRNRIISALADAVLVVEARKKSGTLITVDMALEQGREVYAIPGRCTDGLSMGCNELLRQGAAIATDPEDIIHDMAWEELTDNTMETGLERKRNCKSNDNSLSLMAQEILRQLDVLPVTQDYLIRKLRESGSICGVPHICQGLVELELKGLALRQNGQYCLSPDAALKR